LYTSAVLTVVIGLIISSATSSIIVFAQELMPHRFGMISGVFFGVAFGIGGLGHLAVQYAKIAGATVVAVDLVDEKLELAKELGADYTVNGKTEDPVEAIKKLGGADAVVCVAVGARVYEQAFNALRRGGTLVFVAMPADNYMQLPIFETVLNGIKIVGSIVGTPLDLAEVYQLHAAGKTKVIYETRRLEQVNEAMEEVEHARIPARLVFDMSYE